MKKLAILSKILSLTIILLLVVIVVLWGQQWWLLRDGSGVPRRATTRQLELFNVELGGQVLEEWVSPTPQQE